MRVRAQLVLSTAHSKSPSSAAQYQTAVQTVLSSTEARGVQYQGADYGRDVVLRSGTVAVDVVAGV
eukprot:3596944-Rhodomonas_salina.1